MAASFKRSSTRVPAPRGSAEAYKEAVAQAVSAFGAAVTPLLQRGVGSEEDALRAPFVELLTALGRQIERTVRAHGEVRLPELSIRPDYMVDVNRVAVGYVELKAPGRGIPNHWRPNARERKQWAQLQLLPNVLYSDGELFAVFRWGEQVTPVARLDGGIRTAGSRLRSSDSNFGAVLHEFLCWGPPVQRSLEHLIRDSARLCQLLRDEVLQTLKYERTGVTPRLFVDHLDDWRTWLFPRLTEELFADAYAQTVTFGLLLARRAGIAFEGKELPTIGRELSKSHLLVGRALSILTEHQGGPSIEARSVSLQTLRRIVGVSDWTDWRSDSFDQLYEHFLNLYDPDLRKETGSYFTPRPLADFIVRFVDQILQQRLKRRLGFAHHDIVAVDPAMGTGTFLLSAIGQACANVRADGADEPAELRALLARLIGFERQIAPYAVAELKLHQELASRGLEIDDEKVRFYVTDTLDDPHADMLSSPYVYKPIAESRRQAIKVKIDERVMVVIGNPPFLEHALEQGGLVISRNRGKRSLIDDFRGQQTGRFEIKLHNLNVYFWRWAAWKVFEAHPKPEGVIAFVTTSAYTTGPGFAGMREYLRRHCSWGWIIDLSPEGHRPDVPTRVFRGVQQPICVGIFARESTADTDVAARVRYIAVSGTRDEKFARLRSLDADDGAWLDCSTKWTAAFRPSALAHWNDCVAVNDLMPWSSSGIKPNRTWVYAPERAILLNRWRRLLMADVGDRPELMKETRDRAVRFRLARAPDASGIARSLGDDAEGEPLISRIAFRSFDRQYVIADRRVVDFIRPHLWAVRGKRQVFATTMLTEPLTKGPAIVFTAEVPDMHHLIGHHGGRVMPLYRDAKGQYPNFSPGLLALLSARLATRIEPEELLAYIAAVASHGGFTARFNSELRTPGLRFPITADALLWRRALAVGRRVIWLHTYGERYIDAADGRPAGGPLDFRPRVIVPVPGQTDRMPSKIAYEESDATLHVGDGVLGPVDPAVWEYEISGMQVVKRWFDYRAKEPRVRWSSPLNDIVSMRWTSARTEALRELLAVLHECVALEPEQSRLLDMICSGPLVTTSDFEEAAVFPPPRSAARPVVDSGSTLF